MNIKTAEQLFDALVFECLLVVEEPSYSVTLEVDGLNVGDVVTVSPSGKDNKYCVVDAISGKVVVLKEVVN
jgi:hypothetical protein